MLKTAMIFTDKMVLQREKEIPVWGQADPGEEVTITFDGQKVTGTADANGDWKLSLAPHAAGTGYEMRVETRQESLSYRDVCVGEVWLAGGQSNMEYPLGFDTHADEMLEEAHSPFIRFFDYPEVSYEGQLEDFEYKDVGFWRGSTKEDLPYYSAVGYYFAKDLQHSLDIPVGIVGCNWGGTPACAWMDPERLRGTESEFWLTNYLDGIKNVDAESYKAAYKANPLNDRTKNAMEDSLMIKIMKVGLSQEEQASMVQFINEDHLVSQIVGSCHEQRPGGLYETMLKKVVPFAVRGVIWYQGETDSEQRPEVYETTFGKMIENWRDLWGEELPFLFVQLAPYGKWLDGSGKVYPIVRACQERISKRVPNTWMASIGDAGMEHDIHPKDKKPVGERLALLARGHIYGEELVCDAPEIRKAERKGEDVAVSFENAEGLHLKGDKLQAMSVVMKDGTVRKITEAEVQEGKLILHGCRDAAQLRFAMTDYYEVNLYNVSDIPVKPFVCAVE